MISQQTITPDSYRYPNMILFTLVALINNIPYQALSGVAPIISKIYNLSTIEVNINPIFFTITYVLLIFPSNYLIDQKGLKISTLTCQILMVIGLIIRCFINIHFYFFLAGSFICALGYCIILSACNKFPNTWFLDRQIVSVKSLVLAAIYTSDALGIFLSTIFITQDSTKQDCQNFFIVQSAIMILFNLLNILFFKGAPKTPQNFASQKIRQQSNYTKCMKQLVSNKNYMKIFMAVSLLQTTIFLSFVCFSWMGDTYNFTASQIGSIFIIINITGIIGASLNGVLYKDFYKKKCQILGLVNILSFLLLWLSFQVSQYWLLILSSGILGLSLYPTLVTMFDFAAQTAFPIGQATSGGSLPFGSSILGFVVVLLFSQYISDNVTIQKCRVTMSVIAVFSIVAFVFLSLSKQDLKRSEYEKQKRNQQHKTLLGSQSIVTNDN